VRSEPTKREIFFITVGFDSVKIETERQQFQ